jgi:hypothetical protein
MAANPLEDTQLWPRVQAQVTSRAGDSPDRQDFVIDWYERLASARRLASRFKVWYYTSVSLTSLAAATIPALVAFTTAAGTVSVVLRIIAAVLGVLVAFATAVTGVVQVGNRWRVYRAYAYSLEDAAWSLLAAPAGDTSWTAFAAAVTAARQVFERSYLSEVAVLAAPAQQTSAD